MQFIRPLQLKLITPCGGHYFCKSKYYIGNPHPLLYKVLEIEAEIINLYRKSVKICNKKYFLVLSIGNPEQKEENVHLMQNS